MACAPIIAPSPSPWLTVIAILIPLPPRPPFGSALSLTFRNYGARELFVGTTSFRHKGHLLGQSSRLTVCSQVVYPRQTSSVTPSTSSHLRPPPHGFSEAKTSGHPDAMPYNPSELVAISQFGPIVASRPSPGLGAWPMFCRLRLSTFASLLF
ncbi:unnamed protein product [Protopolystoma xenopodis]|uniref:Uncharacterized protein n=1 Tax=Protopolystoma xenopodis TaxID=117903 RepID=A0A3S5BLS8_9PLAT|nr:unnamed protein product [Protopolystoma xenopodis]